jgi:hypothetical protein
MQASQPKAPEDWRSPRRYRAIHRPIHTRASFDILALDFFGHLTFVIWHSTTGSWSECTSARNCFASGTELAKMFTHDANAKCRS